MSIIYRPEHHTCYPPTGPREPKGTIWVCDRCGEGWVADGNDAWRPPFPFGPAARRIKAHKESA